jgi:hypothetical protein
MNKALHFWELQDRPQTGWFLFRVVLHQSTTYILFIQGRFNIILPYASLTKFSLV